MATTYVVTQNPLWPTGTESEDEWMDYPTAVNDANRKASGSTASTTFYVHEKVTRPVYKSQRNVTLITEVIDGDDEIGTGTK